MAVEWADTRVHYLVAEKVVMLAALKVVEKDEKKVEWMVERKVQRRVE
jgi:hypothetical protein